MMYKAPNLKEQNQMGHSSSKVCLECFLLCQCLLSVFCFFVLCMLYYNSCGYNQR